MLYLSGFSSTNRHLVVIDKGLKDRDQLITGVLPHTTVLVLDRQEDCLNRVREVLRQHDEIDGLHLVGHGKPGQISLGQNALNASNLLFFADKVKAWADFLVSSSQILLYGCRTGAGIIGRRFVQDLAMLTGAEVFASKSLVGGAALGGSWDLTVSAGGESAPIGVFTEAAQKAYRDVLATPRLVKVVDGLDLGILNGATGIGGELLFTANVGSELWISDGTDPGTVLIKNFPENIDFPPTNVNGIAYFARDDGNNGVELWKSDGTATGTVSVSDINVGVDGSFPLERVNVNGTLFFSAFDNTSGYELWNSSGGGAFLVKDIIVGDGSSGPHDLTNVNGRLFFVADDKAASEIDTVSPKLWISDGTDGGTTVVKDPTKDIINFSFLEGPIDPTKLIGVGNILFFEAGAFETGRELWRSDGTESGTFLVKDITPGNTNSDIQNLTNVNGTLFFTNSDVPDSCF
jgi:ELWxxDGT repeat protein